MVVEGVATSKSAYDLSKKHKIDMPITTEVYKVLYDNKDPHAAIRAFASEQNRRKRFKIICQRQHADYQGDREQEKL